MTILALVINVASAGAESSDVGVIGASSRRRAGKRRSWVLRRVRAARLLAQEQFRLAFEEAPIGLALVGLDGRFLRVNAALCELIGYSEQELLASTFQDVTHPDDLDADLALVQETLRGERTSYRMEKRYLRRDDTVVDVQLDVSLVRDDMGEPLHFMSQIQDVTERNRSVEALRTMQAIQAASLDALEQGIAVVTMSGEVKLMNRAGVEILGCTAEELSGQWHESWQTFDEEGAPVSSSQRPIITTLTEGVSVEGAVGFWRSHRGTLHTLRVRTVPIFDDGGEMVGAVAAFADITEQRLAERAKQMAMRELEWRANHDALTGLPNRGVLLDRLETLMRSGRPAAVLFIDLDHFKAVNDSLGHESGDELLKEVANRIVQAVRSEDTVARFGGDEFVVLAEGASSLAAAEDLADRVATCLTQPVMVSGGPVELSASIGIAYGQGTDAASLLRRADVALYQAKAGGRDRYSVCHQSD